jgi:SAM-dependent MidA family methyltransferase
MERALHDPERGYYARRIAAIGTGGDFTTAPKLSMAPARALAAQFLALHERTGIRDIVELGPGDGSLSARLSRFLPWLVRRRVRFHLVESSPVLTERQRERFRGRRRFWHRHPGEALAATDGGRAFLFSNELVDAFPVRRFRLVSGAWSESHVARGPGGQFAESFLPVAQESLPDSTFFTAPFPEGTTVEVHESYRNWLAEWLGSWTEGEMITIDYGGRLADFRRNGPTGTLRAYLLHQRITGPDVLANPGRQDLTADINFDDLLRWSAAFGLESLPLQPLAEFLAPHSTPADTRLLDPQGAGEAFLVLRQRLPSR